MSHGVGMDTWLKWVTPKKPIQGTRAEPEGLGKAQKTMLSTKHCTSNPPCLLGRCHTPEAGQSKGDCCAQQAAKKCWPLRRVQLCHQHRLVHGLRAGVRLPPHSSLCWMAIPTLPWPSLLPGAQERNTKGHSLYIHPISKALCIFTLNTWFGEQESCFSSQEPTQ